MSISSLKYWRLAVGCRRLSGKDIPNTGWSSQSNAPHRRLAEVCWEGFIVESSPRKEWRELLYELLSFCNDHVVKAEDSTSGLDRWYWMLGVGSSVHFRISAGYGAIL